MVDAPEERMDLAGPRSEALAELVHEMVACVEERERMSRLINDIEQNAISAGFDIAALTGCVTEVLNARAKGEQQKHEELTLHYLEAVVTVRPGVVEKAGAETQVSDNG